MIFICNKRIKHILLILLFVVFAIIIFAAYWVVIHPILSWVFPIMEHRGVDIYTSGEYLEFEDGALFEKAVNSLDFIDECIITDFYYCDTRMRDNLYYGKMCDTYALDLQVEDRYQETKESIASVYTDFQYCGDYALYVVTDAVIGDSLFLIATNDTASAIRCLMITETKYPFDGEISSLLRKQSGLIWE